MERAPTGLSCTENPGAFGPVGSCVRAAIAGFVGLPAFALVVAALAVPGLRMLGRVEATTDRSWLLCLLGLAAAHARSQRPHRATPRRPARSGLLGSGVPRRRCDRRRPAPAAPWCGRPAPHAGTRSGWR